MPYPTVTGMERDDNPLHELAIHSGDADKDFINALHCARKVATNDGLEPEFLEHGVAKYADHQAAKAACLGREDAAASAVLQLAVLRRLDRNRSYMSVIILLLIYIAAKLS